MPVQTRARAPANRVYSSPAAQQQVKFQSRKLHATARRSLGAQLRSRQQTLTQIDFVSLQRAMDDDEGEDETHIYDEENHTRNRKRRRTEGDAPSSTSNFHTQTLTQLEFVSTPASRFEDLDDVENDVWGASPILKQETNTSPDRTMGPPKTPNSRRAYEVPSSQSPLSPASVRSRRSLPARSPLKALDINLQERQGSPSRRQDMGRSPRVKSEIQDTFEYENESQQSRVPQTPDHKSSAAKIPKPPAEPQSTAGTQKYFKDEIQDSDEEDEDLESRYDDLSQESQLKHYTLEPSSQIDNNILNPIFSDTQEAEEQLESTMLQFTQHIHSTVEEEPHIRPSQATTVSLTQPPTSSPIFSRRPNHAMPAGAVSVEDDEGLTMIPDSPSHQLTSDLSISPTLPRLPIQTQQETMTSTSITETQTETDIPHVPFSLASSQILTRSQMLPESLMNDSVPAPPLLIEDSDYEE